MASTQPALVALCGSLRRASFNRQLLRVAVEIAAGLGARVDVVEPPDLALPLYDGDLEAEQGVPAAAQALQARIAAAQGLLVASPEYNHSIPGPFKNAIDWTTRGGNPYAGKTVALMGASPGGFGAVRSLQHLRQVLMSRGAWIAPSLVTVSNAATAFDAQGALTDERTRQALEALVQSLLQRL